MKVLSIIHYPVFGGPHNRNLRVIPKLSVKGIDTCVLLSNDQGNAYEKLRKAGIDVISIPIHRIRATADMIVHLKFLGSFVHDIKVILQCIRENSVDLVQINGLVNPHGALAASIANIPVVWQLLDTRAPILLRRLMMPVVSLLADAVMCTGLEVAKVHPGASRFSSRLVTFFPPVDTRTFRPEVSTRISARNELNVPMDALLIGAVGNLNPQKGHEYLIQAAGRIKEIVPKLHVRIIGAYTPTQAGYAKRLQEEARRFGLFDNNCLQFIGSSDNIQNILPGFDIFVMTSVPLSEGIPTAILEAMSCGIPVVATDVGSVREVVDDGITGFVVPPLNPEAIACATLRLLQDYRLRRRMGDEARQRAVERYDIEVCADTHVRAFEAALAHHRWKQPRSLKK